MFFDITLEDYTLLLKNFASWNKQKPWVTFSKTNKKTCNYKMFLHFTFYTPHTYKWNCLQYPQYRQLTRCQAQVQVQVRWGSGKVKLTHSSFHTNFTAINSCSLNIDSRSPLQLLLQLSHIAHIKYWFNSTVIWAWH